MLPALLTWQVEEREQSVGAVHRIRRKYDSAVRALSAKRS